MGQDELGTFEGVYGAHYPQMVRVAHLLTGSNEVAEDIVEDAFVGLHARLGRVGDPVRYLYRLVVEGSRARARQLPAATVDGAWEVLERLSERQRTAVVLRFYAALPLTDIAELMGCRPRTVASLLRRALRELDRVMAP